MAEAEIIAALVANDIKAIRPMLSFLAGQTDQDHIQSLASAQEELRQQLKEVRDAAAN